jgi:DNA (cytosine-5)-methyltransferase 1
MKPRLLDLYAGAGGAARGYQQAGFYVVGVDHKHQPNYADDEFFRDDVFAFLDMCRSGYAGWSLGDFDAIHASPPCQASSRTRSRWPDREYPELIPRTRELLVATGLPYVIGYLSREVERRREVAA